MATNIFYIIFFSILSLVFLNIPILNHIYYIFLSFFFMHICAPWWIYEIVRMWRSKENWPLQSSLLLPHESQGSIMWCRAMQVGETNSLLSFHGFPRVRFWSISHRMDCMKLFRIRIALQWGRRAQSSKRGWDGHWDAQN